MLKQLESTHDIIHEGVIRLTLPSHKNNQKNVKENIKSNVCHEKPLSIENQHDNDSSSCYFSVTEIERLQNGGKQSWREERRPIDVIKEKPIRVAVKIIVPVRDHPKV
jgi:hypothetical protein